MPETQPVSLKSAEPTDCCTALLRRVTSEALGRHLVAARPLREGELLLACEEADVATVREKLVDKTCAQCFFTKLDQPLPLACETCRYVFYCSERCGELGLARHQAAECAALARLRSCSGGGQDTAKLRLATQIMYRRRSARCDATTGEAAIGLADLCTGIDVFKTQLTWPERRGRFKALASEFATLCHDDFTWEYEELEAVLGQIQCNSFELSKRHRKRDLGVGMYAGASLFNHSCQPNVIRVQQGSRLEFLASRDVAKEEALCIAYTDPRLPKAARQHELWDRYGFHCRCVSCED
eukprot:TRINITY_DN38322_c0_g2_i1.p1 TRINITY_DN38322_c0_g2~~TRINITY_DN38322_c0_g2_i1.p1  ORF type:complete len:335 (+),score=33.63 TRINITY_DN38322_c0_g2_i1:116-1006(+)